MRIDELHLQPDDIDISLFETKPIYKSVIKYMRRHGRSDDDIRACLAEFENSPTRDHTLEFYENIAKKFYEIIERELPRAKAP